MKIIGNILWFILCGLLQGLFWIFIGVIWCITIIGIPVGLQCFKFGILAFFPFGKEVVYSNGVGYLFLNILWIIFGGLELAVVSLMNGVILCITIIGIPFGLQCFKMAKISLMPFGAEIVEKN